MAITTNDNFKIQAAKPIDHRYLYQTGAAYETYASASDANILIPPAYRYLGLTILVTVDGENVEYWYKDGVTNADLVLKTTKGGFTLIDQFYVGAVGKPQDGDYVFQYSELIGKERDEIVIFIQGVLLPTDPTVTDRQCLSGINPADGLTSVLYPFNQDDYVQIYVC